VPTGLIVELPSGFELQVRPQRRLALNDEITVHDTSETIDSGCRQEIQVVLRNNGRNFFTVNHRDVIAQLALVPVWRIQWVPVGHRSDLRYVQAGQP